MVLFFALFPAPPGSRPLSYCTRDPTPYSPIHTCLHEAQDIMWIWFEILIMDKIT